MDHTPFIVASYAIAFVVLSWCALTPRIRLRRLRREMLEQQRRQAARNP